MGKMYTLKPDESINDHMKESITMLNELVESIGVDYYHNSTMIKDMKPDSVRFVIEHIRNTIEMLDELTDELEDREDEIRREYEERVVRFFNSWMNTDMCEEYKCRAEEATKQLHHCMEDRDHFRELAISRNKELEEEREKSNQLEKDLSNVREVANQILTEKRDLRKECDSWEERCTQLKNRISQLVRDRDSVVDHWTKNCEHILQKQRELLAKKDHEIWELQEQVEYWEDLAKKFADPDGHKLSPNNPCNFCGNCKHYAQMHKDNDTYEGICVQHYIKRVDPDDASCEHFKSNQVDNKPNRDKPDQPCCKECNRDDCDSCNLCPF